MQKNVASQTWKVFAFDRTTNAPKTGDAANITAKISIDNGAAGATNDVNPTEIEDGFYYFDLTQAETNGDELLILPESVTANIQVVGAPAVIATTPSGWANDVVQTGDSFSRIGSAGAGLTNLGDSRVANLDATVSSRLAPTGTLANVTSVNGFSAGAIDAAAIATDAIDADALATDAVNEVSAAVWAAAGRTLSDPAGFKKNTAADITFVMRAATDGRTPIAGETVTAQRSLDGAAFGACANSVTEIGNGAYIITLAAADLNGDIIILRFTSTGADDLLITIKTET